MDRSRDRRPQMAGMVLLVTAALAGCGGGSGEGLDAGGRPVSSSGGGTAAASPATLASIQQKVFTPICSTCHSGAGAPAGLRLDAGNAFNLLVGVASAEVPSLQRVKPGDPTNSYLIHKIEGHAAVGARMPLGGPYLDTDTINAIRQWIADGASATAAAPAAPTTPTTPTAPTEPTTPTTPTAPTTPTTPAVSFSSLQAKVFTPICAVCHTGNGAPAGLQLDASNSFNLLVGVASREVPTLQRVKPGDATNSYLIHKLEGHAAVGARMPLGGPYLDEATIADVKTWINAGALKDTP